MSVWIFKQEFLEVIVSTADTAFFINLKRFMFAFSWSEADFAWQIKVSCFEQA
jgi:hypothetical protein